MRNLAVVLCMVVLAVSVQFSLAEQPAAPAPVPELKPIESSVIKEVAYRAETQVLTVVFADSGDTYEYKGVPESVYKELMAAESKGTYFAANIKGKYEFTKK
ncbi:MAG: KTSC domain-containing protein [Verrucomicrobiota bacterium]